jgi:hypothetical protein
MLNRHSTGYAAHIGSTMMSEDFLILGCWKVTGKYKHTQLSFIVWRRKPGGTGSSRSILLRVPVPVCVDLRNKPLNQELLRNSTNRLRRNGYHFASNYNEIHTRALGFRGLTLGWNAVHYSAYEAMNQETLRCSHVRLQGWGTG